MSILHITNGDGAANLIKASVVEGDVLPWRDPMHHGPFPANLDIEVSSEIRAKYLAGPGPGISSDEAVRGFRLRDEHLKGADRYDEVVLWFEHDLLDQLQILQLLDWFAETEFDLSKLKMICIDRFEGFPAFRGLGELSVEKIGSLVGSEQPVTQQQLNLARIGWAAFRSSDPRELEAFVDGDLSALPFLERVLRRHLEEYPWVSDGLTRTERQIVKLVAKRNDNPGLIFAYNMDLEDAFFIGDWPIFRHIQDLANDRVPLLHSEPYGYFKFAPFTDMEPDEFLSQRLSLTDEGRAVLKGKLSAKDLIDRDMWLGGVHLKSGQPMWMWDDSAGRLELVS